MDERETDRHINQASPAKTPLEIAIRSQVLEAVCALLDNGVEVNTKNAIGIPPLHDAVSTQNPDIVQALLNAGAFVNAQDLVGFTPLHWAASMRQVDLVRILLIAGADVTIQDELERTAEELTEDLAVKRCIAAPQDKAFAISLSQHARVGVRSPLCVLPAHLLRRVALWLVPKEPDVTNAGVAHLRR